jgi:hypothetical protein
VIGFELAPLVARLLRRDHMFVWVTNAGGAELTANSIVSLRRAGVSRPDRLVVAVLDDRSADVLESFKFGASILRLHEIASWRTLAIDPGVEFSTFNSQRFRAVCLARYVAIDHLLGVHRRPIAYADSDVVYLRDPTTHFRTLQSGIPWAVLAQNDRRADLDVDEWSCQYDTGARPGRSLICAGFTVWQPVRRHRRILRAICDGMLAQGELPSDQVVFNRLGDDLLGCVTLLRQDLFPNGSMCFGNKFRPHEPIDAPNYDWSGAYMIHANWMIGIENKVAALKEAGLWYL